MDKRRLIEQGKNVLIVALTLSALYLSGVIGTIQDYVAGDSIGSVIQQEGTGGAQHEPGPAAQPLAMMISPSENAHHGVKYDGDALSEVYGWFTASLGEALGSSGEPVEVGLDDWERALSGRGVFFDYLYPQSMSTLSSWLGTEISSGASTHTSRRFCLAVEGSGVVLYYIRDYDGSPYRCETALNAERLAERLDGYAPNGAVFAFELGSRYSDIDPYYAMLEALPEVPVLEASNPLTEADVPSILPLFGISDLVASSYSEDDGTAVYIEGDNSLRVSPDGEIKFSSVRPDEAAELTVGTGAIISRAYSVASQLPRGLNSSLQLTLIQYDWESGEYTVAFEYVVDGVQVCFGERRGAMVFKYTGEGELVEAEIICRSYTENGSQTPMPERQALSLVSEVGGGEPMLAYVDSGAVSLTWVIKR